VKNAGRVQLSRIILTDVFVRELVAKSDTLRLVLYGLAIHNSYPEIFHDSFVNGIALETSASSP
jgi:hypothetical protein